MRSINASGHKFGLSPLGVGWVVWREPADLPQELVFHVNYLGGDMLDIALNFSRPGGQVACQYYNFLRLGKEGYRNVHTACYETAQYLAEEISKMGLFEIIYDGAMDKGIPATCWKLIAAYLQLYQAANAGLMVGGGKSGQVWFGWQPGDAGWLSCALQFAGTILFNFNTFDALIPGLSWWQQDSYIWVPNILGSVLLLSAGYLAWIEVCHAH